MRTPQGKMGVVFAEVYRGQDSKFNFYRENAADLLITKEHVDSDLIKNSKIIVTI